MKAARERILELVDPALVTLGRVVRHKDPDTALRAARDILDRAGYGAPTKVEHSGAVSILDVLDD